MSDEGKTVTIELSNPITAQEGQVRKVVLREPKYRDIIGHGKPYSVHRGPDGRPIVINDEAALEHYVDTCCVYPSSSLALLNMHLHDAMNVRGRCWIFSCAWLARAMARRPRPGTPLRVRRALLVPRTDDHHRVAALPRHGGAAGQEEKEELNGKG